MGEPRAVLPGPAAAPATTPSGAQLRERLGEQGLSASVMHALVRRLEALPEPGAERPLADCVDRLAALVDWVADGGDAPPGAAGRLRVALRAVDLIAAWRARLEAAIGRVLDEVDFAPMLEIGLPNDRGLYEETVDRLARRLLPRARDPRSGRDLLAALVPTDRAARFVSSMPPDLAAAFAALGGGDARLAGPRRALEDAVVLLATRTSAIGLGGEIRERSPACALAASPFYLLPRLCDALFSGVGSTAACVEQIEACREVLRAVLAHLDEYGVSVDVVYRLEVVEQNLDRIAELLAVRDAAGPGPALALTGRLALAQMRDRSLRDVVRTNGRLLARKIVERAGSGGEHYITSTRREWRLMLLAGAGGGVVTVGTTFLKYKVAAAHLPLFLEGFGASLNYAGCFLLMQLCGFALATKQPSMVAASLAGSLHGARGQVDLSELVDLVARICRSQFAAVVGNVLVGFAGGVLFESLWSRAYGAPFLDGQQAEHTLHAFHPLHSGTVFFAAITGVFLWLSSLGAGWLENFFVYRRLADGIAQHRLGRFVGRKRMERLAHRIQHAVAGIGGNVTIGVLLGMTPVIGAFFGLPLEVRHVTLSTVSLSFAIAGSGLMGLVRHGVGPAVLGIASMLVFNFGVSFALALWVAMRARGVSNQGLRLVGALWRRFYAAPLDFFRPPKTAT